jgi:hypothetical protein
VPCGRSGRFVEKKPVPLQPGYYTELEVTAGPGASVSRTNVYTVCGGRVD